MKNVLLLSFIFILSTTSLIAQLEKGDWMLSGDNTFSGYDFTPNYIGTTRINETIGLMLSDRIMLGANFRIGGSRFLFGDEEKRRNYWRAIYPFLRYNLAIKNNVILFTELKARFTISREKSIDYISKKRGRQMNIGLGCQYFIAPNIAMEAIMGTRAAIKSDFRQNSENPEHFYINIGFKTFLKTPFERIVNLQDSYLKKGNYFVSGSGFFRPSYANNIGLFSQENTFGITPAKGFNFGLLPKVTYFKTDRWLVGGGLEFGLLKTGAGYRFNAGLNMNTSFYIPLKKNKYLLPSVEFIFNRRVMNADKQIAGPLPSSSLITIKNRKSIQSLKFPMSLSLNYFIGKSTLFSTGLSLNINFSVSNNILISNNYVRGGVFSKFEYFFAPNLAINGVLKHTFQVKPLETIFFGGSSRFDSNSFGFSFGLSYFVFKK